jgi:hypothetical protein
MDPLSLVQKMVKEAFENMEAHNIASLTEETYDLFFGDCLKALNGFFPEFNKNMKRKGGVEAPALTEASALLLLNRLNKCAALMNGLLALKVPENASSNVIRRILKEGNVWIVSCCDLFERKPKEPFHFLSDAEDIDLGGVQKFYSSLTEIRERLHKYVSYVRRSEPKLHVLLPNLTQSLSKMNHAWAKQSKGRRNGMCRIEEVSTQG